MAITLTNVFDDWLGALTAEWQSLYDFAVEVLNLIVNIFYTIAIFVKDFAVDHTMWFIFLLVLGWLYWVIRKKTRRIGM